MSLKISVIIPVFKDWDRLQTCLEALRKQSIPQRTFEIILVDNDDTPLPQALRPSGIVYVHEPEGFSYAARNAGLQNAQAAIVAFTDADCVPDARWLEEGLRALDTDPMLQVAGGAIDIFALSDTVAARYDCAYGLRQQDFFENGLALATANMFVRRDVFVRVGPFNERIESGGDFEFCWRAAAAGLRIAYLPEAHVRHPARDSYAELSKQTRRHARGKVDWFRRRFPKRSRAWLAVLHHLRPRLFDWYYTLRGGRGSEILPARQRLGVLAYRILLHYAHVGSMIAALWRARSWP